MPTPRRQPVARFQLSQLSLFIGAPSPAITTDARAIEGEPSPRDKPWGSTSLTSGATSLSSGATSLTSGSPSLSSTSLTSSSPSPPILVVDSRPPAPLEERKPSRTRALVDAVQAHIPGARVVITDNRTVLLSQQTKNGVRTIRAHQMFLDAPPDVMLAVGAYLARGQKKDGAIVDAFVDAQSHLLSLAAKPLAKDAHKGRVHDLMPMYLALNDRYFGGEIDAELGWSQPGAPCRRKRRSITFGSYDSRAKRIVIHPVLDQRDVPELMVARVLHHEMVHAKVGDERGPSGQRIVHGRKFAAEEARFEGAREADAWFDKHLDVLLRWRPGASLFGRRS